MFLGIKPRHSMNLPASRRVARRSQPTRSNVNSRSEYLLEAFIRLLPGHKSGRATGVYTHASQQNSPKIKSPFDDM